MLHIITSNHIPIGNIKTYTDNFILVHLFRGNISIPTKNPKMKFQFDIYHQEEMDLDQDEYPNSTDMNFNFLERPDLTQSLDSIIKTIESKYEKETIASEKQGVQPEEYQVLIACDKQWNQQVVKYLNESFSEKGLDISALNIYTYFNLINYDKLKSMIQSVLGSEFIYPDEPISFSYALYQFIES